MTRRVTLTVVVIGVVVFAAIFARAPLRSALSDYGTDSTAASDYSTTVTPSTASTDAGEHVPARGEVTIDPRRQQLIGVRTEPVRRTVIRQEVRAAAVVRFDETRQAEITTKVDGWIRDLYADYTGRPITIGEPLFTLYSPGLITAQNEYLLALRGHTRSASSDVTSVRDYAERLHAAARERLRRWDVSDADIRDLEERGSPSETVTFRSPVSGTIVEKTAVAGMRVMAGQMLYRVADLSSVWVEADVPEHDVAAIRIGQPGRITLEAYPEERLVGRITYAYPTVDEKTRTAKVRLQFANRAGRLKPGMFATVDLEGRESSGLTVPPDAVLEAGRDQLVFVALGEGRFEPRTVTVGRRTRDEIEITSGLKEGEQVAAGAAFFLDSESQLRAAVQSYQAPPGQAAAPPAGTQFDIAFRPQPDPPRTGENTFEVTVRDPAGQPVADADVSVTFFMPAMPTMNMPAMRNQAKLPPAGSGVYRGSGQVMMAGRWDVTVDVSRGGQRLGSRQFAVVAK